jgi:NTE family protein
MPANVRDIYDRVTELAFNSTFWLELSALGVILALVEEGHLDRERFGRFFFHVIDASREVEKIPLTTKLNNAPAFLNYLFDLGRTTAERWFATEGTHLGQRSTIDLTRLLPIAEGLHATRGMARTAAAMADQ